MADWDDRDGVGTGLLRHSAAQRDNRWRLYSPSKRWLFGVSGHVTYVPEAARLDFDLEVDLNPTRFLAHQADPSLETIGNLDPLVALRVDPVRRASLRDQTLDGNDNVLIGRERFPAFSVRDAWWRQVVETYLAHVRSALSAAFAPPGISARLDRFDFVSPRLAELHWELDHRAAIHWVDGLRKTVREADAAATGVEFMSEESAGNSVMLVLPLTGDIRLKVYPKMCGRVRFEIEYEEAGRIKQVATKRGRYANKNFVDILLALRIDAANRFQKFWSEAMALRSLTDEAVSLRQFITAVVRAAQEAHAETVLDVLIANRRLEQTGPSSFAPKPVCDALEREGVIVRARLRNRTTPQYALAAPFSRMLDAELSGNASPAALH
ncbi:hypothetical protein U8607_18450 [Methylobacterium durans]|uniref:hypothetical protein n=1 Tax=Methylobacterium durans TaxID=2202825 RepID=UPI002AFF4A5B|nr:hypothetical protein [Methylobacterium durans]MEA1834074.1 hypothetical protein [Methylobacterium durans]